MAWVVVELAQPVTGLLVSAAILALRRQRRKIPQACWPATLAESMSSRFTERFCLIKPGRK